MEASNQGMTVKEIEGCIVEWGVSGQDLVDELGAILLLLLRASELFAKDGVRVHEAYCLKRGI